MSKGTIVEVNSFFFASGFALFIALLAWGDRIRRPRDDIAQLEKDYITHLGKKKSQVLPILRPPSQYSFANQMSAVIDLFVDDKIGATDLSLRKQIVDLRSKSKSLECWFDLRYYSVVVYTIISLIFGILSTFNGKDTFYLKNLTITFNSLYMTIFILILFAILSFLVISSEKEKLFIKSLNDSLDNMEE